MTETAPTTQDRVSARVLTSGAFAALAWYLLLGHDTASWLVGLPCVALCAWFSAVFPPAKSARFSTMGWLRLVPFFLLRSLAGGWDVAKRVLTPGLPVRPHCINFDLRLPVGPARVFFVQFIGLLPGTLAVSVDADCLTVHVLTEGDHETSLRVTEQRVAAAFAVGAGS